MFCAGPVRAVVQWSSRTRAPKLQVRHVFEIHTRYNEIIKRASNESLNRGAGGPRTGPVYVYECCVCVKNIPETYLVHVHIH